MKDFLVKMFRKEVLEIVEPSEEVSESYLNKSESNFVSAKILLENEKLEECVGLVYYSMYNMVLCLLFKIGIKSKNHLACIYLLEVVFDFDNSDLVEAKKERIDKQYYVDFSITKQEVDEMIVVAEGFNRELKGFILGLNLGDVEIYRKKFKELVKNE